jgi:hypothetical protein
VYYTQLLRITSGLKWLAIVLASLLAIIIAIAAANGAYQHGVHGSPDDNGIPLPALFGIAGFVASFFASRYARTLSEENEAHLPVVWTKPVSRVGYALGVIGVDVLGILAAFALTLATALILIASFQAIRFIQVPADSVAQLLRYLALPLAYYGVMTALTASFGKAGRGLIGWAWCASLGIMLFNALGLPKPWSQVVAALNVVNPIAYASYSHTNGTDTVNIASGPHSTAFTTLALGMDISALLILGVGGLAAGMLLWRRVEA